MKKFFKFALCGAAVVAFAACGNNIEKDAQAYVDAEKAGNTEVMDSLNKVYEADNAANVEFQAAIEKLKATPAEEAK